MHKQRLTQLLKMMAPVVIAGAILLSLAVMGYGIPCVFRTVTGIDCPGCGATRMVLALLRLDFAQAIAYNPMLFFAVVILAPVWAVSVIGYLRTGKWRYARWQNAIFVGLVIVVFGAWLIRTLPAVVSEWSFLADFKL